MINIKSKAKQLTQGSPDWLVGGRPAETRAGVLKGQQLILYFKIIAGGMIPTIIKA